MTTDAAAEVLFENGAALTQDPHHPRAEAVALKAGEVLAVGTRDELAGLVGPGTRRVDLQGGAVLPGFIDSHTHVWKVGQLRTEIADLRPATSISQLLDALRAHAASTPDDAWVLGRGYNEARLAEGRRPTRADLDAALPGRKVYLTRTCGHIGLASTAALQAAGVGPDVTAPEGGAVPRDPQGQPTGELVEAAMRLVTRHLPSPDPAAHRRMLAAAGEHLLSVGVTGATDAGVTPALLEVYRQLDAAGGLPLRYHVMLARLPLDGAAPPPLPDPSASAFLRVDTVKLFADGGLSGATAALCGHYRHDHSQGLMRLDDAALRAMTQEAAAAGLGVAVHAIGDRAIEASLDAFEAARNAQPSADAPRPTLRIEHGGLPTAAQLARAARLDVAVAPQAIFLDELGENFRTFLDEDYLSRCYPLRSMLDAGLLVALSSDAPVVRDDHPLRGVRAAVTRAGPGAAPIAPGEAITVAEALYAYTAAGADLVGEGARRGRLCPGALADLVVLSGDPTATPAEDLADLQVRQTWVGGQLAYEA